MSYAKYAGLGGGATGVTSLDSLTGALTLVAGTGISISDNAGLGQITIASTSSGDVTLGPFGSTPNANGLSISGSQVLNMQPADGTNPGGVSILDQAFAGIKSFLNPILHSDGSAANPAVSFINETNSGLYRLGVGEIAFSVLGLQTLDFKKSTGAFGNIGMGGAASVSDSYPVLIQRSNASTGTYAQISNPDTSASSKATWQLAADLGANTGEVSVFTAATGTDAYSGAMTVRPSDSTKKLSLIGGDLSTGYVTTYVAGDYTSAGESVRFNADKTANFMQSVTAPASPAAGLKFYNNAGVFSSKTTGGVVSSFAGINTGDVTIGTANGLSLSGQALSLTTASGSTTGALTSSDWTTFSAKQAPGSYITSLTGDGTAAGPGAAALTLAATQNNITSIPNLVTVGALTSGTWNATTIAINHGGTGVTSVTTAPAATAFAGWDANKNLSANNLLDGYATTATAAGTTTLTVASAAQQYFTGSTTQTVVLPVATTLVNGWTVEINNNSSDIVTVTTSGANTIQAMAANTTLTITCINTAGGTGTASWNWLYAPAQAGLALTNPMTTGGDIIYGGASGVPTRLANGSASQVLTSAGGTGAPTWSFPGVTAKTTTYSIAAADNIILCSGSAFTVTLPTAVGVTGKQYTIKKTDASLTNQITIATTSSQTIDGVTTRLVSTQNEQFTVVSDGANWQIKSHTYPSNWVAYTPTFTNLGTVTSISFFSRRSGDSLQVRGVFTPGTGSAAIATITMGYGGTSGNVTADTTKLATGTNLVGHGALNVSTTTYFTLEALVASSTPTLINLGLQLSTQSALAQALGTNITVTVEFFAEFPISGWDGA